MIRMFYLLSQFHKIINLIPSLSNINTFDHKMLLLYADIYMFVGYNWQYIL